jgi:hypothetical protein
MAMSSFAELSPRVRVPLAASAATLAALVVLLLVDVLVGLGTPGQDLQDPAQPGAEVALGVREPLQNAANCGQPHR